MPVFKNIVVVIGALVAVHAYGMENSASTVDDAKNIAIVFDVDHVISYTFDMWGSYSYEDAVNDLNRHERSSSLACVLYADNQASRQRYLRALRDEELQDKGEKVRLVYLIKPMVESIEKLKAQGRTVVAATNQNNEEFCNVYRKAFHSQHDLRLNNLFDGILTRAKKPSSEDGNDLYYRLNESDNVYVTRKHGKPELQYFQAVAQLVKAINPAVTKVIYVDDLKDNVQVAQQVMPSIHFEVAGVKNQSTCRNDLVNAMTAYKNELKTHGVNLE